MKIKGESAGLDLPASPLFEGLDETDLEKIAARARRRTFAAGSTIYEEGEFADSVYIVVSGDVRKFRVDRETSTRENVVTLGIVGPGGNFGEASIISPKRPNSVEAFHRAECLQIMKEDMIALMIEIPMFGLAVSQAAIKMVAVAEGRICNFGSGRWSSKRLASLLLRLADEGGVATVKGGVQINQQLTQSDMASIIQSSRETVSVQLKKLREAGAVLMKGKSIVVYPAKLREIAG